jgi:hypothetical protein
LQFRHFERRVTELPTLAHRTHLMRQFTLSILVVLVYVSTSADERPAQTIVITTKPRFEQRGQFVDLVISDTNHSLDISWWMPPDKQFGPVLLDTNRVYTFTVVQKPFYSISIPKLCKVQSGSQTIYDIEVCEIHKTKMEYKEVEIAYGLVRRGPNGPSRDIERRLFPNHREYSLGGCGKTPDDPKTDWIYVCSDCRNAYEKWKSEQKKTK